MFLIEVNDYDSKHGMNLEKAKQKVEKTKQAKERKRLANKFLVIWGHDTGFTFRL